MDERNELEIEETKKEEPKEKHSFLYDIYSLLHDLVYILGAITLIFVFCVRLVGVSGGSMLPTLKDGDYLALQSNVIMGDLEYGDIVVARELSFRGGEPIVKRVIATEGQRVVIRPDQNGDIRVYVDDVCLDEPYINYGYMDSSYFASDEDHDDNQFSTTVSEGCVFVMGDNRNHSADSRDPSIGEIKIDQVMGKVLFVFFPGEGEDGKRDYSRIGAVS